MTIEEIIKYLPAPICGDTVINKEKQKEYDAHDLAVIILRKYQEIVQIYQKWDEVNDFSYNQAMREIGEVMEDKSEESNGGTYSKNILQGCKRAY